MDLACQAPLSVRFPRQEYWGSCHFLSRGFLPQGLNPPLLHWQVESIGEPPGKPVLHVQLKNKL